VESDFLSAGFLLEAGIKCAVENVHINMAMIKDPAVIEVLKKGLEEVAG